MNTVNSLFCILLLDEEMTLESFLLLTDENLKELGVKMGMRKLILRWIEARNGTSMATTSVVTPMSSPASSSRTAARPATSASASSTPVHPPEEVC